VYRFGAPLYFANAPLFLDEVEEAAGRATGPVRWFVLDAEAMVDVDTTGSEALRQAITMLTGRGLTFAVSRAHPSFLAWLEKYHLMPLVDPGRFYRPTGTRRRRIARRRHEGDHRRAQEARKRPVRGHSRAGAA